MAAIGDSNASVAKTATKNVTTQASIKQRYCKKKLSSLILSLLPIQQE